MKLSCERMLVPALLAASAASAFAGAMCAQVQTKTETTSGQATREVKVERGEVVYISGNDLIVKMEDGEIRHISNVPESARITVEGKQLGVHDLKPGMKLERTIMTTTTPRTITTVKSVTGKVWYVNPPNKIILTLEDGTNQEFTIPKGQKFNVDGQMLDAFALKKGMNISATKVTEVPETVVAQQRHVTGKMPPPPPPPPADVPILVVVAQPAQPAQPATESAAAEPKPAKLPKTGSQLPLVGLLGLLFLAASLGSKLIRAYAGQ